MNSISSLDAAMFRSPKPRTFLGEFFCVSWGASASPSSPRPSSLAAMGAEISSMFVDKSDAGLEAAFAKMDKNNNGKINTAELKAYILQSYGSTIDDKTIREMMATADTNRDGEMDLNEFKVVIRAGPKTPLNIVSDTFSRRDPYSDEIRSPLRPTRDPAKLARMNSPDADPQTKVIPAAVQLPRPGIVAPPATVSKLNSLAGGSPQKQRDPATQPASQPAIQLLPDVKGDQPKPVQEPGIQEFVISKRPGKGFRIAIFDSGLIANLSYDGLAAGLKIDDTLLSVNGVGIKSAKQLYDILGKVVDSSLVTFKVKRSIDHRLVQEPGIQEFMISKRPGKGFRIAIFDSGLIANLSYDGLAAEAGLKIDDTLVSVNGVGIKSAKQLYDILGKVVDSSLVTFKVKRSIVHIGKKMRFTLYGD